MKYKSELINEIVENEGHCSPSLHYESECVDYWIESIRGAYPKLTDYEGEWLDYYLENNGIGEFPYLAINNIISTTVENTVPIPFKSAFLKGSSKYKIGEFIQDEYAPVQQFKTGYYLNYSNGNLIQGGNEHKYYEDYIPLPTGVTSITAKGSNQWKKLCCYDSNKKFITGANGTAGIEDLTLNIPSNAKYFRCSINTSKGENEYINVVSNTGLLLASSNYNIPCELISCNMPVLTTTGKNLYNIDKHLYPVNQLAGLTYQYETNSIIVNGTSTGEASTSRMIDIIHLLKNGNTYTVSTNNSIFNTISFRTYNTDGTQTYNKTIRYDEAYHSQVKVYIQLAKSDKTYTFNNEEIFLQIEEGSVATSYEPFKSNNLTVNEDVELRGIGDVKDTLDLMTGELTQRVSGLECIDQNSKLSQSGTSNDTTLVVTSSLTSTSTSGERKLVASHELIKYAQLDNWYGNLSIIFKLPKSNENFATLANFKQYLTQNPFYYYRELEQNEISIKPVDLSIIDESGNKVSKLNAMNGVTYIETNGTPLNPTFSGEIPVEAITQNLHSFIEEE